MSARRKRMLEVLREQIARMETERASKNDPETRETIERFEAAMGLLASVWPMDRRDGIRRALALGAPFPEWTPGGLVEAFGADPAERHPWAPCFGFRGMSVVRDQALKDAAQRYVDTLRDRGVDVLPVELRLMLLSDDELDALERKLESEY